MMASERVDLDGLLQFDVRKLNEIFQSILKRLDAQEKKLSKLDRRSSETEAQTEESISKVRDGAMDRISALESSFSKTEARLSSLESNIKTLAPTSLLEQLSSRLDKSEHCLTTKADISSVVKLANDTASRLDSTTAEVQRLKALDSQVDALQIASQSAAQELLALSKLCMCKIDRQELGSHAAKLESLRVKVEEQSKHHDELLKTRNKVQELGTRVVRCEDQLADCIKVAGGKADSDALAKLTKDMNELKSEMPSKSALQTVESTAATIQDKLQILEDTLHLRNKGTREDLEKMEVEQRDHRRRLEEIEQSPMIGLDVSPGDMLGSIDDHSRQLQSLADEFAKQFEDKVGRSELSSLLDRLRSEIPSGNTTPATRPYTAESTMPNMRIQGEIDRLSSLIEAKLDRSDWLRFKKSIGALPDGNGAAAAYRCLTCDSPSPVLGIRSVVKALEPESRPSRSSTPSRRPLSARQTPIRSKPFT
mmetsp:Transcript_38656/g.64199  ORF Transcript_38656/g.64199 Transcript_38656/m.64199 type:complete len:480 (-) Transcript_38656:383-1822(-)